MESDGPPVFADDEPMSDLTEACSEKYPESEYTEAVEAESAFEPEPSNGEPHPHDEQEGEGVEAGDDEVADLEAALGSEAVNEGDENQENPTESMEQSESTYDREDSEMKQDSNPDETEEENKPDTAEREQEDDSEERKTEGGDEDVEKPEKTTEDGEDAEPKTDGANEDEKKEAVEGEEATDEKGDNEKKEDEGVESETPKPSGAEVAVEEEKVTTISDEEYYANLDPEELEWYKEHPADHDKNLNCTACFKQVTGDIGSSHGICRHPGLGVGICKQCRTFYKDGNWQKDEDGYDVFCRWCAEGGELILCDKCPSSFCKRCLQRNLGRKFVSEITSTEEWKCLACDPKQIYELRALYHAVYSHQEELKAKKSRKGSVDKKSPAGSESGENFLDENLTEAYTILDTLRKALDDVKDTWETANKVMEPEIAVTITRKLRKVFAINKQSMDQLDKSIVISFVGNYPHESKRIHMGKVEANNIDKDDYSIPAPRRPKKSRKPVKKGKKVAPKKSAAAAKKALKVPLKSGKKGVIVVNGRPVTGEYVSPALKKAGKSGPVKKRAAASYRESDDEDSDIEVIGTLAPPPLKKRKTGTKSRY